MEVPHTNLTEVTRVVLVDVGAVVVLTTGHTTTCELLASGLHFRRLSKLTTGMLPVLSYTTVTWE